ncbi:MAG: TfoX/Sxy family protein [Pseudomonadota bacterium]
MAPSISYLDYLKDLFSPFGAITIRKMFGGAGIYCDGAIFAITGDEGVWFKVDDVNRVEFEAAGLTPFTVEFNNGKIGQMSYYRAPDEIFDDADSLHHWTALALGAASRAKKPAKENASKRSTRKKSTAKKKIRHQDLK